MQQPQSFKTTCRTGTLHIENGTIFIAAPLRGTIWASQITDVFAVIPKPGLMTAQITLFTTQGEYAIQTLQQRKLSEILTLLNRPQTLPIDMEIERAKFGIEQRRLELREVNMNMSNQRAHYQQSHVGGFAGQLQRGSKNAQLKKSQPEKEKLQQEKLLLEKHLIQLQLLKSQGATRASPLLF